MRVRILAEVALGLGPGADAGDEPALLADVVRLLGRVEGDRRVEVREADDQQAVDDDVDDVSGCTRLSLIQLLDRRPPAVGRQHVGEQDRQVQHRAGEDDRDDARLVHLQRDVGALAAVHAAADHPLGELHRDAALALLDEHDGRRAARRRRRAAGRGAVVPFSALSWAPAAGNELTTEAKISSDMPLPMPRWLMSSPIHMSSACRRSG